ncbi:MAG: glycoside hydrolase family 25 protein [Lachnospiraceae bacterium]|nr:glycoside hydrolase family 25 protein [Lachnospiraceae bacterium]
MTDHNPTDEEDFEILRFSEEEEEPQERRKPDPESRKKKKRRRGALRQIALALFYLLLVLLILYGATTLYLWIDDRMAENLSHMGAESGETTGQETTEPAQQTDPQADAAATQDSPYRYTRADVDRAYELGLQEGRESVLAQLMESLAETTSVMQALRPLYPKHVIVASGGTFHFVRINEELKKCALVQEELVRDAQTGELSVVRDGETISHKGIDVSSHQGEIKWDQVAADGVEFAIIRVLFRGYGSGAIVEDERFDDNISGALANGVQVGAYVFSQAITEEEMLEEANLAIEKVSPYAAGVPIVIDVERVAGANPRMDALSPSERTDLVLLFCETVRKAGYQPYIYFNTEMSILFLELERLEEIPKWYASYSEDLFFPYAFDLYQYSEKGSVQGIKGNVDLDVTLDPFWEAVG